MTVTIDLCRDRELADKTSRNMPMTDKIDELLPFFLTSAFPWLGSDGISATIIEELDLEDVDDVPVFPELQKTRTISFADDASRFESTGNPQSALKATATINFVDEASRFESAGDLRSALRSIYENAEKMARFELFDELDKELVSSDLNEIGSDLLLGLLTATLPQKSRLPSRKRLFQETKRLLKKRGHYERGILDGLK